MTPTIVEPLLEWYGGRDRDVPWRGETDPYRIWVAEVMAQQTRVATVRAYHGDFLERFPDVETLAHARLDDVLKSWQGLGYYSRARNLHAAAGRIVAERDGAFPRTAAELRDLPGVGPYTAGAIASFAFGEAAPAVDGNARRVLARLFDMARPTPASLDAAARGLLDTAPGRSAEINQALMDLGSGVCRPRRPRCDACPVRRGCRALADGTVEERPVPTTRTQIPHRVSAAAAIARRRRLLVIRREEDGLLGGLWDLPSIRIDDGADAEGAIEAGIQRSFGVRVELERHLISVDHTFSHFRLTLDVYRAGWVAGDVGADQVSDWVAADELEALATPTYLRNVLPLLGG